MADTFGGFNVGGPTVGFDRAVQELILRNVIQNLRWGTQAYLPAGSVVTAVQVPGANGTYRFTNWTDVQPDLTELGETTPPDPTFLAGDDLEFSGKLIGQYVPITYLASIEAGESLTARAISIVSRMAAEAYGAIAQAAYAGATTDIYAAAAGSTGAVDAGDVLDSALLVDIVTLLRARSVKPLANGRYALVGHPQAFAPLLKAFASGSVNAASFGTVGNLIEGSIGAYLGFDFVPTEVGTILGGDGASSIDVHKLVAIGSQSIALSAVAGNFAPIVQPGGGVTDPLRQIAATVGYKAFAGAKIVSVSNRSDGAGNLESPIQRCVTVEVAAA